MLDGACMSRRAASSSDREGAREGAPRALPRNGRIRRHGFRRVPGAAWSPDRPGSARGGAGPPLRWGPAARRRRRSDGRRGPRDGAGDRLLLRGAPDGGRADRGPQRPASAGCRDSRPSAGSRGASTLATRRDTGSIATPSGTGRGARSGNARRSGCGPDWTWTRWGEPRRPSRAATTSAPSVGPIRSRSGTCITSGSGGRGTWSRSTFVPMPSCEGWSGAWSPPSSRWGLERSTRQRSPRHLPSDDRPSTGPRPRRGDCASVASSLDGDGSEATEKTRNDEREDLHGPGERDRATLVRRGRDGPDTRPPRDAGRARPLREAQAHLHPAPGHGRPRDRPQCVARSR